VIAHDQNGLAVRPFTLAEARYVLSHVFCVSCLPEGGWTYPWALGAGEALCSRCPCRTIADLRLRVATVEEARSWVLKETEAGRGVVTRNPRSVAAEGDSK
jgi:hypothetical protein